MRADYARTAPIARYHGATRGKPQRRREQTRSAQFGGRLSGRRSIGRDRTPSPGAIPDTRGASAGAIRRTAPSGTSAAVDVSPAPASAPSAHGGDGACRSGARCQRLGAFCATRAEPRLVGDGRSGRVKRDWPTGNVAVQPFTWSRNRCYLDRSGPAKVANGHALRGRCPPASIRPVGGEPPSPDLQIAESRTVAARPPF